MRCMATSGLRLRIFSSTLPNLSMKVRKDFVFSCRMFTKAMDVRWRGRLVVNWAPNFVTKVSTQCVDRQVNQLKLALLREVENTRHNIASYAVYKLICVRYASTCSSGLIVPSYLSSVGFFQVLCKGTSMIAFTKGLCRGVVPRVLVDTIKYSLYKNSRPL